MVCAWHLAIFVSRNCRELVGWNRHSCLGQYPCESSPLRRRRKKGAAAQAIGISRGGETPKFMPSAIQNAGRLLCILRKDKQQTSKEPLRYQCVCHLSKNLLADKAYDAGHFRDFLINSKINAVIPSKSNRKFPSLTTKSSIVDAMLSNVCSGD